jgi:putative flippase GtrA
MRKGFSMTGEVGGQARDEAVRLLRFVAVGIVNTAIGYGMILLGLLCGLGDYAANVVGFALGLPISYALHRRHTFQVRRRASVREGMMYLCAFLIAYGANIGIIAAGRATGFENSAVLQAVAICCYAGVLFALTRFTFRPR